MSIDQYQRNVNALDKEIADLEKKKAGYDKKAADEARRASNINISKNASASIVKSKLRDIEKHAENARKAEAESAKLQQKIADKRKKRNDANKKLQSEQQREQKKQQRSIKDMQRHYEQRIAEIENASIPQFTEVSEGDEEYDVFVSHAWEDKESFVDEFVLELESRNIKVWYDRQQIKWGDSMRKKIDDGLKKSKFGVAVLSPNYIAEGKYWTKAELDGLFQLESINGKTLLPIWHELTKAQVIKYSPLIASKLAMTTANMTAAEIADELVKLLPDSEEA